MASSDPVSCFWKAVPCKTGRNPRYYVDCYRDVVEVEGETVAYLLWGNEIAVWNGKENILTVRDCGWWTPLTRDRLNRILRWLPCATIRIYSERGGRRIYRCKAGFEDIYRWEGEHTIDLENGKISPAKPIKTNRKVSRGLGLLLRKVEKIYWHDEPPKIHEIKTLTGYIYLVARRVRNFHMYCIAVKVDSDNLPQMLEGSASAVKVYRALNGNPWILLKELKEAAPTKVLEWLKTFGTRELPEQLKDALGLAALLN
ncbi:MAG: hypothetical protein ACTSXC_06280 [Candidatus Freyarchaeota archaeon]